MNSTIKKVALLSLVTTGPLLLNACKSDEVACAIGSNLPQSCNLYTAEGTDEAPIDQDIVLLGDSLFDYGEPHGAIPLALVDLSINSADVSGKTYFELNRSGAKTEYIRDYELPKIPKNGPEESYSIKTVIINGGPNDIRFPCESVENSVDFESNTECQNALSSALSNIRDILTELNSIDSLETIIWTGPQYFTDTIATVFAVDSLAEGIRDICENEFTDKCTYVDNRTAWTVEDAESYTFDKIHVNEQGAEIIATNIWEALETIDAYR